ncbi:hypothetical protein REL05_014915 [Clostridioides difficile]|nr:hypothetical protein [Clostridioides difficile]MCI4282049.1 hypothetical protein [Clostridioides difficile]MCP3358872.1 hypothetical protein [Clostridioides difficile]MDS6200016.1 hypothetical protein [Clostridioides difficile]HBF8218558.1 hypothetical protein [Clostridioides difficile]
MDIYDIAKSSQRKAVFGAVLEEACRQWCCFIDDAPERKDGEGFADFFYEVFKDKEKEYAEQLPYMKNVRNDKAGSPRHKDHER